MPLNITILDDCTNIVCSEHARMKRAAVFIYTRRAALEGRH